jgi:hypothetical protein
MDAEEHFGTSETDDLLSNLDLRLQRLSEEYEVSARNRISVSRALNNG